MHSDRELLELAAKAAALEIVLFQPDGTPHICDSTGTVSWRWNPLTDDGDLLRLAVKLGIRFRIDRIGTGDKTVATVRAVAVPNHHVESDIVLHDQEMAAVRLVVTMVAAEIGKAMP